MKTLLPVLGVLSFGLFLGVLLVLPFAALRCSSGLPALLGFALVTAAVCCSPMLLLAAFWGAYALLPAPPSGRFELYRDRGSVLWALNNWPSTFYLRAFQGVLFLNPLLQFLVLRAFRCELTGSSLVTSKSGLADVRKIHLGVNCVIGEYAQLSPSYMPRPGCLIVEDIHVGSDTLIGGYSQLAPGVRVGNRVVVQYDVKLFQNVRVEDGATIGSGSRVYGGATIGAGARLGKECVIGPGVVVPAGAVVADFSHQR